jgi:hypothetical protein
METDYLERRLFINTLFKQFGNCEALMVLGQFSDSNLAVVLAFLTLQDKHTMLILSVIIKSISALCETDQTKKYKLKKLRSGMLDTCTHYLYTPQTTKSNSF